ncbi:hypothetical protein [Rossellomorea sp. SC111]|uniref:hypothetical protein n=1 Tax=Rossellomorea sp. SC111 TaxID=2968985 RepID=UPI00215A7136|nr:hypothetical protein [Rossellomorea sp. SC111]
MIYTAPTYRAYIILAKAVRVYSRFQLLIEVQDEDSYGETEWNEKRRRLAQPRQA